MAKKKKKKFGTQRKYGKLWEIISYFNKKLMEVLK